MFDSLKIKFFYYKQQIDDKNKITSHIANGLLGSFFYIEFDRLNLSFEEMVSRLIYEEIKFYNLDEFNIENKLNRYTKFHIISERVSTKEDLNELEYIINHNVLYFMDIYKEENYENILKSKLNQNVAGYYKNNVYISSSVPKFLLKRIFSSDNYITLINEKHELMLVMRYGKKLSLFYSLDDQ